MADTETANINLHYSHDSDSHRKSIRDERTQSLQDSPYGFPIILIASITLSTFGVWLFRKRRWF